MAFFCSFSGFGFGSGCRRLGEWVRRRQFKSSFQFWFRRIGGRWRHHSYAGHLVHQPGDDDGGIGCANTYRDRLGISEYQCGPGGHHRGADQLYQRHPAISDCAGNSTSQRRTIGGGRRERIREQRIQHAQLSESRQSCAHHCIRFSYQRGNRGGLTGDYGDRNRICAHDGHSCQRFGASNYLH